MPVYGYVIIAVGWAIWLIPFLLRKGTPAAEKTDRRARWGVIIQAGAYVLLWQNPFWTRPLPAWRVALSVFFFIIGPLFSWGGVWALGRQWRIDAGLNPDHELVRRGAYRLVRHPIYTSMLCLLLAMGFMLTPLPMFAIATALLILGTEIRVRVEEGLLESRFGGEFDQYKRCVPAFVPFLKFLSAGKTAET
jgi:protein-S-isoprenylcysteine O-methyltransferase Ste14